MPVSENSFEKLSGAQVMCDLWPKKKKEKKQSDISTIIVILIWYTFFRYTYLFINHK